MTQSIPCSRLEFEKLSRDPTAQVRKVQWNCTKNNESLIKKSESQIFCYRVMELSGNGNSYFETGNIRNAELSK